jgi:hypothetical protein
MRETLTILVDAHERSNRKMGGIGLIMQTPNYPENVAEKNSPESLVVRFAEPVGTEADSCDSQKLSVSELSKRIHVECPCFLSRTKAVRNRKPLTEICIELAIQINLPERPTAKRYPFGLGMAEKSSE